MGCSPSFEALAPGWSPQKAQHSPPGIPLVHMTTHLAWGHPVPGWAHLPVWPLRVKEQQLKAQPQTLFLGGTDFWPPGTVKLRLQARATQEELLLDDTRVHRRRSLHGRARGCLWPLAGKCPPIAVTWAEAREGLGECSSPPKKTAGPPGSRPHQYHSGSAQELHGKLSVRPLLPLRLRLWADSRRFFQGSAAPLRSLLLAA